MLTLPPPGQPGGLTPTGRKTIKLPSLADRMPKLQAPQPSTMSKVNDFIVQHSPETQAALHELKSDPLSMGAKDRMTPKGTKDSLERIASTIISPVKNFVQKTKDLFQTKPGDLAGGYGKDLELIAAGGRIALSPISSFFHAANEVPVFGTVSRLFSLPFTAGGEAISEGVGGAIDKIPDSLMSKSTKEKIKPGLKEVASLVGQLYIGKAADAVFHGDKIAELKTKYSPKDVETIIKKTLDVADQHNIAPEVKKQPTFETSETGQLKLAPPEEVPLLSAPKENYISGKGFEITDKADKGKVEISKALNTYNEAVSKFIDKPTPLNLRRVLEAKDIKNSLLESDRPAQASPVITQAIPVESVSVNPPQALQVAPDATITERLMNPQEIRPKAPLQTAEPIERTKASGLSKGVEANAVESKLTKGFDGLSEYETINIKEQAQLAKDLIKNDYERAKKIAMGEERAPGNLKEFSVYTALERHALEQGDVATLRDLATSSKLNAESSGAAQTLRLLAERDPESPVGAMKEIADARQKNSKVKDVIKAKKEVKSEIEKEIKKPTKEDWNSFVDSLVC